MLGVKETILLNVLQWQGSVLAWTGYIENHTLWGRSIEITTFNIVGLTEYMVIDNSCCKFVGIGADTSTLHGSKITKIKIP